MTMKAFLLNGFCAAALLVSLSRCGVATYPGQPGFASNNYSKIDMEYLDTAGLFFYEVSYDNRVGGAGVGAIVTKLYPDAKTYTSNVRTNADGALFRSKAQYDGAEIQMISMPKLGQIYVAPNSVVQFLIDYENSVDEVDDQNVAEKTIFTQARSAFARLSNRAMEKLATRLQLLRAATLKRNGSLAYTVSKVSFGTEAWKPASPVQVETTLMLNAVRTDLTMDARKELADFVEAKFPKGYKGDVELTVKGLSAPLKFRLGVHTLKTAKEAGLKVISKSNQQEMRDVLASVEGSHQ